MLSSTGALIKAPLLIGCDVTDLDQEEVDILTNPEVIAISQDTLGQQGHVVAASGVNDTLQVRAFFMCAMIFTNARAHPGARTHARAHLRACTSGCTPDTLQTKVHTIT